ncbi:prepilin-type N-terminal cleavage/methylation domain-containing protein [Paracidovorax wautersii]|uniref:Prepilin-type N-terminal cleavage/methylation domain-containing protein n=1 Tax=Paracidovorax wautersii TaxID=1177982 RepID=A0ABU1I8U2_9BURK|nr:prepilin-type N-terminal cleavage/methylation domain-containing protein [Paracidovorax wautersii]MDR6212833.1 prepilin-type N-terminal cleavage/methylation domain-containing protein [Paracidovorax wautersii]
MDCSPQRAQWPRHAFRRHDKTTGFTLIEMMAVMVLLGLLSAIILPNFEKWFGNTERRVEVTTVTNRLHKLLTRAALLGADFELSEHTMSTPLADGAAALELPAGWRIAEDQKLLIRSSGLCDTQRLTLSSGQQTLTVEVEADTCEIKLVNAMASP